MKKLSNFGLDANLIKQEDKLEESRTLDDTNSLQMYTNTPENNSVDNVYNVKLIDLLHSQIAGLKEDYKTG